MFQRPFYQAALVLLTVLAASGGLWLAVGPSSTPGVEIILPTQTPVSQQQAAGTETPGSDASTLINVNTATAEELETLPNIGPVLAERIVAYREELGPFQRVDQLMAGERIGPATYEAIRHLVTVGE